MKRWAILFVVMALLVLAACGGEDDDRVELQAVESDAPAGESASDESAAPAKEMTGTLVYVQGTGLYVYPLDGEPEQVVEELDPELMWAAPGQPGLIYATPQPSRSEPGGIYYLDVTTRESFELAEVRTAGWMVRGWSPDGDWVLLEVGSDGLRAVRCDGTDSRILAEPGWTQPLWLVDGRLLLVEIGRSQGAGVAERVVIFDLNTGEETPLEVDKAALVQDFGVLDAALAEAELELADPLATAGDWFMLPGAIWISNESFYVAQPASGNLRELVPCGAWDIRETMRPDLGTDYTVIYQADDVLRLSGVQVRRDGSLTFLEWRMADCRLSGMPDVALKHVVPGEEAVTLVPGSIYPGLQLAASNPYLPGVPPAALSPDGTWAAWASGSLDTFQSALNVTDLATGATILLIDAGATSASNQFVEQALIRGVYWW